MVENGILIPHSNAPMLKILEMVVGVFRVVMLQKKTDLKNWFLNL